MNSVQKLMNSSKTAILNMQERRENKEVKVEEKKDTTVVDNFVEYAKRNEFKVTNGLIECLIDKMFDASNMRAYPGIPVNNFYSKDYHIVFTPNVVVLPIDESSLIAPRVDFYYKNPLIQDFCEENNQGDYIYLLADGGKLYSVAAGFDKKFFENLGFTIYIEKDDLCITGNKEACLNLLKKVNDEKEKFDLTPVAYKNSLDLEKNDKIVNNFVEESKTNADIVALNICKKILSKYQPNSPVLKSSQIITTIKTTNSGKDQRNHALYPAKYNFETEVREFCEVTLYNGKDIYLIPDLNGEEKIYRPVFDSHLRNALSEMCSDFIYDRFGNIMVITDTKKFEELVLASKGRRRK